MGYVFNHPPFLFLLLRQIPAGWLRRFGFGRRRTNFHYDALSSGGGGNDRHPARATRARGALDADRRGALRRRGAPLSTAHLLSRCRQFSIGSAKVTIYGLVG